MGINNAGSPHPPRGIHETSLDLDLRLDFGADQSLCWELLRFLCLRTLRSQPFCGILKNLPEISVLWRQIGIDPLQSYTCETSWCSFATTWNASSVHGIQTHRLFPFPEISVLWRQIGIDPLQSYTCETSWCSFATTWNASSVHGIQTHRLFPFT